jgi:arginase
MSVVMVGAPTSAGAFGVGQEQTPAVLRELGIVSRLRDAGVEVIDGGDVSGRRMRPDPAHPKNQNLEDVVAIAGELRDRLIPIMAAGDTALVLGGDCTITLGAVAAAVAVDPQSRLVYFDGDADISTPSTTRSGILDAMGMGHLLDLDGAADSLAGIGGRRPLLPGEAVAMVGFESGDITDAQAALLGGLGVHLFPAERLRSDPEATVTEALATVPAGAPRVLHFDVDAVDSIDLPLAHYPHFNTGVSLATATAALAELCRPSGLAALVVTEANPLHDPDRTELPRLVDTVVAALASRT